MAKRPVRRKTPKMRRAPPKGISTKQKITPTGKLPEDFFEAYPGVKAMALKLVKPGGLFGSTLEEVTLNLARSQAIYLASTKGFSFLLERD